MTDETESNVQSRVDTAISENTVVIFMKGTEDIPRCGYSKKAVDLVSVYVENPATVDVLDELAPYRDALESHSSRETIPQVFVEEEFVGGSDILEQLWERDELEATLAPTESA